MNYTHEMKLLFFYVEGVRPLMGAAMFTSHGLAEKQIHTPKNTKFVTYRSTIILTFRLKKCIFNFEVVSQ